MAIVEEFRGLPERSRLQHADCYRRKLTDAHDAESNGLGETEQLDLGPIVLREWQEALELISKALPPSADPEPKPPRGKARKKSSGAAKRGASQQPTRAEAAPDRARPNR